MADNKDRLKAFEDLVGKEKAAEVLGAAKEMSEKAEAFLASKEQKTEEVATVETEKAATDETTKELQATLVSMKEAQEKSAADVALAIKEQGEKTDKLMAELAEKNAKLEADIAQVQKAFGLLMGIQPKSNARGFRASTDGDEAVLTKEQEKVAKQQEKSVKTEDSWLSGMTDFVIHGKQADAA